MKLKHLIYSSDFTKQEYDEIIRRFNLFLGKGIPNDIFKGKVVATLFFQPSTRTMSMFQSAAIRGGGGMDWSHRRARAFYGKRRNF